MLRLSSYHLRQISSHEKKGIFLLYIGDKTSSDKPGNQQCNKDSLNIFWGGIYIINL